MSPMITQSPMPEVARSGEAFASAFRAWCADHDTDLAPYRTAVSGSLADGFAHERGLRHLLWQHGWTRWGWPIECGGLGGSALLRAILHDELAAAGYIVPESFGLMEIVTPTLLRFAPELARRDMPAMLRGDELWCQGFSEPDAGSDLASLRTRAIDTGDQFVVSGQKTWTSRAHIARRCLVLARTGEVDSRHRGITALWIDLESPGVTVTPLATADGRDAFCEVFFDDVRVPRSSLIGEVGGGWAVAMYLLQFERGNYAWQRQAGLTAKLQSLVTKMAAAPDADARLIGEAYLDVFALRSTSIVTLNELTAGRNPGPAISVDKLLLSTAERAVLDTARQVLWPSLELDDSEISAVWRQEWWFSRATSILGGSAEVQHDILAERVLGLPKG